MPRKYDYESMDDATKRRLQDTGLNKEAAQKERQLRKQNARISRDHRRSEKKLAKEKAKNAVRSSGYDGVVILLNEKGQPCRVPVVYDDDAVPAPAHRGARRTVWVFDDCVVRMTPWRDGLSVFDVRMGGRHQTVIPRNHDAMRDMIVMLDSGISPVNRWDDGDGGLVCPRNGVPVNGYAPSAVASASRRTRPYDGRRYRHGIRGGHSLRIFRK